MEYNQNNSKKYVETNKKYIERIRLNKILNKSLEKPMLLVLAGAGYGKTETVSNYLNILKVKTVWLQIEKLDDIPSKFWNKLIKGMFSKDTKTYNRFNLLGFPNTSSSFDQFLHMFATELVSLKKTIIVLDDFHLIEDDEIKMFVEKIVISKLMNLKIIVISRKTDIFSRIYSRGIVSKINEDDLRFSLVEVEEYFKSKSFYFSKDQLIEIYNYTDGWVFAIYLVWLNLTRNDNCLKSSILKVKLNIFDLIEKEIFSACSLELQKFLIKISILDDIPLGLLREIARNTSYIIDEMQKSSLLITYNDFSKHYKIHHIFRAFLIEKQSTLEKSEIIELQLKIAIWYKKNGQLIDAINYYKKCNYYEEIFNIILNHKKRCSEKIADMFIDIIDNAPTNFLEQAPIMQVVCTKLLINNGKTQEAQQRLIKICTKYEKMLSENEVHAKEILGETYIILALISYVLRNYEFVELFKMADNYLPNGSRIIDKTLELNLGNVVVFVSKPNPGEFSKFMHAIFDVTPYATRVMNGCGFGMEYLSATKMSYNMGNLKIAEKNAYQTIYKAQHQQQNDIELISYYLLLRISIAAGNNYLTDNFLKVLKAQKKMKHSPNCLKIIDIAMSWFYNVVGEYNKVADWIKQEGEVYEVNEIFMPMCTGIDILVRSRYYLAQRKYKEILNIFENENNFGIVDRFLIGSIEIEILRSICYLNIGCDDKCLNSIEKAYNLSVGNSLIMGFVEYGKDISQVVFFAKQNEKCTIPKSWLNNLYEKSLIYAKHAAHAFDYSKTSIYNSEFENVELTQQEIQILTDICNGLSREEVSSNNKLPMNILKSVVKSIYDKLGVSSTVDAVFVATKMKLYKNDSKTG